MRKIFLSVMACMMALMANAESFTAGGETYTYTVKSSSTPSSGVKHTRMRFTSPATCNVSVVEVDLTNSNVKVEAFTASDALLKTEKMTTLYTRKKNAGRNAVVTQNGHFWSMSNQTGTSAGVHATNTLLGGCMVNGVIKTETNWTNDQWNGGPTRTGILGITTDGKAVIGNYKTTVKAMCPAKWGTDENSNVLQITEVNKYCIASDYMALFTPEFPKDRAFKVLNTSAGQPGTVVTGTSTEIYLKMDAGQTLANNTWVKATVGAIKTNTSGGTRGDYDFVIVAAPGVSQNVLASLTVGDKMQFKYYWEATSGGAVPAFTNVIAGNAIVMQNGSITTRATDESYNTTAYARSLYGINSAGTKLVMCVVDKRPNDAESSSGLSCTRASYIMKQFGAQTVLQVDGGGSAQMAVNGSIVTVPGDGSERAVASGIAVYSLGGTTPEPEPEPEPDPQPGTLVEVTPAAGTANAFAFEVTGEAKDDKLTVNYVLNTAASGVKVVLKKNGTVAKSVALGSDKCTEAGHSAEIDLSDLPAGDYTWAVEVTGAAKDAVQEFKSIRFNHPQGVDVDRNFESPYFGRIYVTEGRASTNTVHYSASNGGQGLYMFTPRFIGIQNWITGKYVYTGGVTIDQTVGTKSGADFRKVRVAEDGRIFVTRQNDGGSYLLEAPDPAAMQQNNASFSNVFTGGSLNTTTYAYENGSTFISAPNIGFDVKGGGENLTLAMLSGQATLFTNTVTGASRVDQYALGSNANWSSAASPVSALSGKYTVNYSGTNLCYDNRGGLWYCQYRDAPSATEPALVYIDSQGNQKYLDITTVRGGGGIRFNHDYTQIAIASSTTTISIYDISYSSDNTPTLAERIRITHGMGKNINDIAWDRANNIYAVSNNGEILKAFSIPRSNNAFATEAASQYGFTIEVSEPENNLSANETAEEGYALTQKWAHTEGHLAANTASRWATAVGGKIYVNDHSASKLYYWNENGKTDTGVTSAAGTAITSDAAGNVVVSTSMYAGGNTAMKVLPVGGSSMTDLTITMPAGVTAAQMQYIGKATGDIMGNGGALYLFPSGATSVAKITFKNGVQQSAEAIAVGAVTAEGQSIATPLSDNYTSNDIAVRVRGQRHFFHNNGGSFVAYADNGITTTQGGTVFKLGNEYYGVEPIGTSYRDGFQVVELTNNVVVAKHTEELTSTAVSPNPNCIVAEVNSDNTVSIYQYVPGQLATMYTFEVKALTGAEEVEATEASVVAGNGYIEISGDAQSMEVFDMQGVLISQDETYISCPAGVYLVRVDGKVTKLVVK